MVPLSLSKTASHAIYCAVLHGTMYGPMYGIELVKKCISRKPKRAYYRANLRHHAERGTGGSITIKSQLRKVREMQNGILKHHC